MGSVPEDKPCNHVSECTNEKPRHFVKLPRAFELMMLNVTVAQFRRYTETDGTRFPRQADGREDDSPVGNVS